MTDAAVPTIKVLLVEDDPRLAQLTARYLESHGVVVALCRRYDCIGLGLEVSCNNPQCARNGSYRAGYHLG